MLKTQRFVHLFKAQAVIRSFQTSANRQEIHEMLMPAMSPTMTEGTLTKWNFKEGDSFSSGDILLGIETDKASIDVDAQDDGILAKILTPDNTAGVPVGQLIALLADQGDDISSIDLSKYTSKPTSSKTRDEVPTEPEAKSESTPATPIEHAKIETGQQFLPAALRLVHLHGIDTSSLPPATSHKKIYTKGDILSFLGKVKGPLASEEGKGVDYWKTIPTFGSGIKARAQETKAGLLKEMNAFEFRQLVTTGLSALSEPKPSHSHISLDFDSVLAQYLPPTTLSVPSSPTPSTASTPKDIYSILSGK